MRSISLTCATAVAFNLAGGPFSRCWAANPPQVQREAGYFADGVVSKTEGLLYDEELTRRIDKIGQRVAKAAEGVWPEAKEFKFTFRVINSPEINAASVAGGYIYIYTGLLDYLESEDEMAAVIGHELGHIVKGG